MKIVTIVGARPQFIKARPLSYALKNRAEEVLVHTGQHYDEAMSESFFRVLDIPTPKYDLGIGGGTHGAMTGEMLREIEKVLLKEKPALVIVYGDTNSTLAGGLAAAKLHIPVAHIEAGLRSFNRAMPEEINRILTDHLSTYLFTPSESSKAQLVSEGITEGVHVVGDIMYDVVLLYKEKAESQDYLSKLGLKKNEYYLSTLHRAENVDSKERLKEAIDTLGSLDKPVLFPRHPRTEKMMNDFCIPTPKNLIITKPAGYLEMLQATSGASCVLTDSGGLQKEAYYCGVPCVTLRTETEWKELVEIGWNIVSGTERRSVLEAISKLKDNLKPKPAIYGEGHSAEFIVRCLIN